MEGDEALDSFEYRLEAAVGAAAAGGALTSRSIDTVQVNLGLRCNMNCVHCHVEASPQRTEMMDWPTMERVLALLRGIPCELVDLTGGAPELNPHFRRFVKALRRDGYAVQVRTNLTVLLEPGMESLPEFFRDQRVRLVASMPCYLEKNVRAQRGPEAYERSIEILRRLNGMGYGAAADLPLNLVYNPGGPVLPPGQAALEAEYRRELEGRFGIQFTRLFTITNAPIGRFLRDLSAHQGEAGYRRLLHDAFNPATVEGLMCRRQISIGWDGTLYDCDFNLSLGLPVNHGAPDHIRAFDLEALATRRIVTGAHCYACTAGAGSSCGGALRTQGA
ncbi:MAG: radical SAM/Cys-rich domain protein [Nitrospiraceae bacterium]|nr:radical SAM/Cys-rich domain protein [Nitrospiraceae bacterium]